ncbi:MAG: DUF4139 domain-containing protein [Cypionkella sp.]
MQRFLPLALLLIPSPSLAETILANSHVTAVTIYPQGAQVTRQVDFTAAAGAHDLLITDLPAATEPDLIRLAAPDLTLGAFALRTDRLPPQELADTAEITAAKAVQEAAKAQVSAADLALAAIQARVEAAEAQIAFLGRIKPDGALSVEVLTQLSQTIGSQTLASRQAALAAQADLIPAQKLVDEAAKALADAEAALAALSHGGSIYASLSLQEPSYAALSVAFTAPTAGEAHLTVTHFIRDASWMPVYDMTLDRKAPSLKIDRGVLVSQSSGEDWAGIDLTLSTAQPTTQAEPSRLWPYLREIYDPKDDSQERGMVEPVMEADVVAEPSVMISGAYGKITAAGVSFQGETVVYHYPAVVNVAAGVENLRLALDQISVTPKLEARAVPARDATAFLLASFKNESAEQLLPGRAYLYRDAALVAGVNFAGLAPGAEAEVGFGAIEGLRLKRTMPERSTGDRGFISTSTEQQESAVLSVENLTAEAWPLHVLDQIPYSEQEDLAITYKAEPAASEENYDGQRGILSWQFDLAAGETKEITLTQKLTWPEGKELQ